MGVEDGLSPRDGQSPKQLASGNRRLGSPLHEIQNPPRSSSSASLQSDRHLGSRSGPGVRDRVHLDALPQKSIPRVAGSEFPPKPVRRPSDTNGTPPEACKEEL